MFTRLITCKWWYKPWVTIARGDVCYRGTNMWKIVLFTAITLQLLECTLGAVCSPREKSRAGQQWTYSELCFPCSMGSIILTSENDEKSWKLLTPCGFYAFQVREIIIPKSGGEKVLFQGFIFCSWSPVKRKVPKWAKIDQEHNLKTVQKPLDV